MKPGCSIVGEYERVSCRPVTESDERDDEMPDPVATGWEPSGNAFNNTKFWEALHR